MVMDCVYNGGVVLQCLLTISISYVGHTFLERI